MALPRRQRRPLEQGGLNGLLDGQIDTMSGAWFQFAFREGRGRAM
jgi:hypothetical protein